MKSRKFGIKFCGGCNPAYDRVELSNTIKNRMGDQIEWIAVDDPRAEKVLIICGCLTQCANVEDIPEEKRVWITSPEFDSDWF